MYSHSTTYPGTRTQYTSVPVPNVPYPNVLVDLEGCLLCSATAVPRTNGTAAVNVAYAGTAIPVRDVWATTNPVCESGVPVRVQHGMYVHQGTAVVPGTARGNVCRLVSLDHSADLTQNEMLRPHGRYGTGTEIEMYSTVSEYRGTKCTGSTLEHIEICARTVYSIECTTRYCTHYCKNRRE